MKIAEERSHSDDKKVDVALLRAEIIEFTENKKAAIANLDRQLGYVGDDKQRFRLFSEIGNLSNADGDKGNAIIAYERALRCFPESVDTRFKLALIYGAIAPLKMLGIRHYRIIHEQNHLHAAALHNLGLLYGEFGLLIAKMSLIKRAADENDGHALGNLAHFYVENGFLDDAERVIRTVPTEMALSDRVIAAQQFLRRSEREAETKRDNLVRSAEELSTLVNNFQFPKQFDSSKYLGTWVDTKEGRSTFDIEVVGGFGQYKFTLVADGRKIFGYSYLSSPISQIDFSTVDKQPLGLLWMSEGEIKTALLFGEDMLRIVEPQELRIRSSWDFRRKTIN